MERDGKEKGETIRLNNVEAQPEPPKGGGETDEL